MISIIIPVWNGHDYTEQCIDSIVRHTTDYELIIVDNGSDPAFYEHHLVNVTAAGDKHQTYVKALEHGRVDRLIVNKENLGFPAAVNQGIKAASGDIICLLNNDTIVTHDWALRLKSHLDKYSIVGPVTNYVAGMQQARTAVYHNNIELKEAADEWRIKNAGTVQDVNFIIGFCMVFKKSVFDEVGDFDDTIWPCSGEEVDFCFRAKEKGHRVGIVKDVYIHHYGSKTFEEMSNAGILDYQDICQKCSAHLEKKWGKHFWERQEVVKEDVLKGTCLNLGCGYTYLDGYINIDNRPEVGPDMLCDVLEGLPYDDSTVDRVRADDFLEHIPIGKTIQAVEEIFRVLKPGGIFESTTPSTDGRGAFMDPTHVSFWNRHSWLYYSDDRYRTLYGIQAKFDFESIEDVELMPHLGIIHTKAFGRAVK